MARDKLAESTRGQRVLIIDDNVGHGTTLAAARRVVEQPGGAPLARAAETTWHLFSRDARHNIADVVYPSLHSNFHYGAQNDLIRMCSSGSSRIGKPLLAPLEVIRF